MSLLHALANSFDYSILIASTVLLGIVLVVRSLGRKTLGNLIAGVGSCYIFFAFASTFIILTTAPDQLPYDWVLFIPLAKKGMIALYTQTIGNGSLIGIPLGIFLGLVIAHYLFPPSIDELIEKERKILLAEKEEEEKRLSSERQTFEQEKTSTENELNEKQSNLDERESKLNERSEKYHQAVQFWQDYLTKVLSEQEVLNEAVIEQNDKISKLQVQAREQIIRYKASHVTLNELTKYAKNHPDVTVGSLMDWTKRRKTGLLSSLHKQSKCQFLKLKRLSPMPTIRDKCRNLNPEALTQAKQDLIDSYP